MQLLKDLHAQGRTVILVTHDMNVARQADRIVEMSDGAIVSDTGPKPASRTAAASAAAPGSLVVTPVLGEILRTAGRALRVNLVRTLLTLLGVVIGVASVVSMLAIGNGAKRAGARPDQRDGPDLLVIRPATADQLAQANFARFAAAIGVYRALGGGWSGRAVS
jgi:macrolide transport system ATP-binding/permease protein